ncbi:MAG: zf-HC2 domain-containing protein, partial [Actinobacteria bacterium]|nr:zf-HC2 domain-containing protein [Actinomycetota bacterium]
MTWHADANLLTRYTQGDIDPAAAFSLESHLVACEACRTEIAGRADLDRVAQSWAEIEAVVDVPRPRLVERVLLRLGVRSHVARLLAATPALRLSWLGAVTLALGFAVAAAQGGRGEQALLLFLLVAPLLPVAGVAAAFAPGLDPAHELTLASPSGGFRLLLVRSAAVLGATTVLAGVAALTLPGFEPISAAWLIPALALSVSSLALATFIAPVTAAGIVGGLWVSGVLASEVVNAGSLRAFLASHSLDSAAFQPEGQLAF